jgi:hypothetical protein
MHPRFCCKSSDRVLANQILCLAFARTSLVGDDLASGKLVAPLPRAAPIAFGCGSSTPEAFETVRLAAFREWRLEEVHAFRSAPTACHPFRIA